MEQLTRNVLTEKDKSNLCFDVFISFDTPNHFLINHSWYGCYLFNIFTVRECLSYEDLIDTSYDVQSYNDFFKVVKGSYTGCVIPKRHTEFCVK